MYEVLQRAGFRALYVSGAGLAGVAFSRGRFPLFGMGLIAAYIGLSALLVAAVREPFLIFFWFSGTGIAMLVCLLVAHKAIRGRE